MSKIAIITDTHLGVRNGSKVFRDLFRKYYLYFFNYLKENNIKQVFHLGDFFDDRNKVNLHDIDYLIKEFIPLLEKNDVHMTIIAGNHDVAYRNTNRINSLTILQTKNITIVDNKPYLMQDKSWKHKFLFIPWINDENQEEIFETINSHYANKDTILCGHFEIEGAKMYKNSKVCERGIDGKTFKKFHKVLSGHFHHNSHYGNIEYIGALFHYTWQDYNDWRGFTVYDTETGEFEKVENDNCLFEEFDYHDAYKLEKKEFESLKGKIVRIQINKEYDRIELKELIVKIESHSPVSLDIIDNTILEKVQTKEEVDIQEDKTVKDYFLEALEENKNKDKLYDLFSVIYDKAQEQMIEIE